MTITASHTEFGGGCYETPHSGTTSINGPWSPQLLPVVATALASSSFDSQSGSYTDPQGGKLTWKLKRTPMKQ